MNLNPSSLPAVSPFRQAPRPVRLQGHFEGGEGKRLRKLRDRLPACGAWVSDCRPCDPRPCDSRADDGPPGARQTVELRLEVLVRSAVQLYALLLSLGLELTPASHRELRLFCMICHHRDALAAGAVVEMMLEVSWGAPPPGEYSRATDRS